MLFLFLFKFISGSYLLSCYNPQQSYDFYYNNDNIIISCPKDKLVTINIKTNKTRRISIVNESNVFIYCTNFTYKYLNLDISVESNAQLMLKILPQISALRIYGEPHVYGYYGYPIYTRILYLYDSSSYIENLFNNLTIKLHRNSDGIFIPETQTYRCPEYFNIYLDKTLDIQCIVKNNYNDDKKNKEKLYSIYYEFQIPYNILYLYEFVVNNILYIYNNSINNDLQKYWTDIHYWIKLDRNTNTDIVFVNMLDINKTEHLMQNFNGLNVSFLMKWTFFNCYSFYSSKPVDFIEYINNTIINSKWRKLCIDDDPYIVLHEKHEKKNIIIITTKTVITIIVLAFVIIICMCFSFYFIARCTFKRKIKRNKHND